MVEVKLRILECIDTKGEREEEPYLCISVDGSDLATWGPWDMRQGDSLNLNDKIGRTFEGHDIFIGLSEEDPGRGGGDERYDGVHIVGHEHSVGESGFRRVTEEDERMAHFDARAVILQPHGRYIVDLPQHGTTRYKLYFDTRSDTMADFLPPSYCLELVSLRCRDAQQYADYVYIKVNGERVWGPHRMRTGSYLHIDPAVNIPIHADTSIQLWEEDEDGRDDLFGELRLRLGDDFVYRGLSHQTFSRDRGISGSANYILLYRVRERLLDDTSGFGRC